MEPGRVVRIIWCLGVSVQTEGRRGFRLRNLIFKNISLNDEWLWHLPNEPHSLWHRVVPSMFGWLVTYLSTHLRRMQARENSFTIVIIFYDLISISILESELGLFMGGSVNRRFAS